ncbi:MAG TPA: ABC transporter substrate-binding protein [Rubrobacter sp.]|nr:ABC transporter substrate-binding protein [Rubrobacter sp.]
MDGTRARGRRLTRQDFLLLGAGAGAGLMLAGCGGGPENNPAVQQQGGGGGGKEYNGPKVDLAFWNGFTGGDGPLMRDLVEQFSSEHDNIDVTMNTVEWETYYQKVPASVSTGEGPDVGIMHIDTVATNAARSVIIPLDDVANALKLKESDFVPIVWNAGIYEGSRYGIPLDVHPFGDFYNKDVMEKGGLDPNKPPQTKDEFMAALEELKGKGVQGFWVPTVPAGSTWIFETLLWQYGGELYNEDVTAATWNSDAGVDALTWLVDLIEQGYSPKNVGDGAELIAFQNNNNAFYWSGIWNINPLKEAGVNYGAVPVPQIGSQKATWANSHNFVITNKRGQDPNKITASKVFINWVSTHSAEWAKAGQVPARNSVRESPEFQKLEFQSNLAEQLPYVRFPPSVPGIGDVQLNALDPAVNEALLLKKDPKTALDESASQAKQLLEENRQKYQA